MNVAVILAGGSGTRMGTETPKQFLKVCDRTILEHSIDAFHNNDNINEIVIVSKKDFIENVESIVKINNYYKVKHIVCGGKERYHSTLAALECYKNTEVNDCILIHDAVRPLVTQQIINDCIKSLKTYNAVNVAIPATDTIIQVNDEGCIVNIPKRSTLRNVQTPQGFKIITLAETFRKALLDKKFIPTDDISVIFAYSPETKIHVVEGDTTNIKVTYKNDLKYVEQVINERKQQNIRTI